MIVKQVTVRVENKEGKLKEVLDVLAEKQINVEAISMADTVTRLILSNPEEVVTLLTENGFHAELTDVIRLTVPSRAGALAQMLSEIAAEKINLEYVCLWKCRRGPDDHLSVGFKKNRRTAFRL